IGWPGPGARFYLPPGPPVRPAVVCAVPLHLTTRAIHDPSVRAAFAHPHTRTRTQCRLAAVARAEPRRRRARGEAPREVARRGPGCEVEGPGRAGLLRPGGGRREGVHHGPGGRPGALPVLRCRHRQAALEARVPRAVRGPGPDRPPRAERDPDCGQGPRLLLRPWRATALPRRELRGGDLEA